MSVAFETRRGCYPGLWFLHICETGIEPVRIIGQGDTGKRKGIFTLRKGTLTRAQICQDWILGRSALRL
jgi:hypothetical protein